MERSRKSRKMASPNSCKPQIRECGLNTMCCSQSRPVTSQCFESNNNGHFFSLGLLLEFPFFPTKLKCAFSVASGNLRVDSAESLNGQNMSEQHKGRLQHGSTWLLGEWPGNSLVRCNLKKNLLRPEAGR